MTFSFIIENISATVIGSKYNLQEKTSVSVPDLDAIASQYKVNGFASPIRLLSSLEANQHRKALEDAEAIVGKIHYRSKIHTVLTSPFKLATLSTVLDIVERIIGPNILLYNVTYIIKEANDRSHISWHQDLTYWGLSHDDQVSLWLALSPASIKSGCMKMIPGSHKCGRKKHHKIHDTKNILLQGQTVKSVQDKSAVYCELEPGEASFHHGLTLHSSGPNNSRGRRIGLNAQFLAPHVYQTKHDSDSALLVRGEDKYGNFENDTPASIDLDQAAIDRQKFLHDRYVKIAGKQ